MRNIKDKQHTGKVSTHTSKPKCVWWMETKLQRITKIQWSQRNAIEPIEWAATSVCCRPGSHAKLCFHHPPWYHVEAWSRNTVGRVPPSMPPMKALWESVRVEKEWKREVFRPQYLCSQQIFRKNFFCCEFLRGFQYTPRHFQSQAGGVNQNLFVTLDSTPPSLPFLLYLLVDTSVCTIRGEKKKVEKS